MGKFSIEFKWAMIYTVASLLWMMLERLVGLHGEYIGKQLMYTNLFILVAIPVYAMEMRDKKMNFYNGQMNWTQAFLSGVIMSVVAAALSPAVQYITYNYISPDYFPNMIHHYVTYNKMPEARAEAYFNMRSYNLQGVSGGISMGVIISAIVALIVRTKIKTVSK